MMGILCNRKTQNENATMPMTGIDGCFFRSDDPDALSAWYETYLGIGLANGGWHQSAGLTVVAPFPRSTDYLPAEKH